MVMIHCMWSYVCKDEVDYILFYVKDSYDLLICSDDQREGDNQTD